MPEPVDETAADLADDHAAAAAADATAEPSAMPSATGDAPSEGPSEAVRAVRARFPEPPREGSLRKPEPGQGLALLGIVACAWAPFILWWFFGPIALILGVLAYRKGEKRAKWLVLAAVVCTIAGAIIMALPDRWVTS